MQERQVEIAGLPTLAVMASASPPLAVAFLHGYAMQPSDLSAFAHSLGTPAAFFFPEGPYPVAGGGRSWWPLDRRQGEGGADPRDLADWHPPERLVARRRLLEFLDALRVPGRTLVLAGFSQGGMLALDTVLLGPAAVDGLALFSSSRIALDEWQPRAGDLAGLPVLVTHGREDRDLAFSAGERLADFVRSGGARTTWVPFDGGHGIPLPAWRAFRRFLQGRAG